MSQSNSNDFSHTNHFLKFWETMAQMDAVLQRAVTSLYIPCRKFRNRELNRWLHLFQQELSSCCDYSVFGMSIEERYPGLYQDLQTIDEAVEDLQRVLQSCCPKKYQRLYHAILNFRACLLFFRRREGWYDPQETAQTAFSVFSMFDPIYVKMDVKPVFSEQDWKGLLRLIRVAQAEWEMMKRAKLLIDDLKTGQPAQLIYYSFHYMNEMEYAVQVESKNHFQRNYEHLMGLFKPWFSTSVL